MASQALVQVVEHRRRHILGRLLEHTVLDVNSKVRSCTPLYIACANRDAESINLLLKAGADPNIVHNWDDWRDGGAAKNGYNVLHALANLGRGMPIRSNIGTRDDAGTRRCFKLVLDAGARIDLVDVKGCTPLHMAYDAIAIAVACLLDAGIAPNATNRAGETLLHITRNIDILRILVPRVDIDARSQHRGVTPLLGALRGRYSNGEMEIKKVSLLLEFGADATVVDNEGNGALHHIAATRTLGPSGFLLLRQLHAHGADVNLRNHQGETPLHRCLNGLHMKQDFKMLDELLAAGAELGIKDNKGQSALFQMMNMNYGYNTSEKIEMCERMVAAGARIDTTDLEGRNLLHCALQSSWSDTSLHLAAPRFAKVTPNSEMISELRALGVDPVRTNNDGQTPLHVVSRFHSAAFRQCNSSTNGRSTNADYACFFDCFVGLYKNVDCVDNDGVTPLHVALTFSEYLTRRLLEEGADPRKKTLEGLTPLHLAARSRQSNTLGILLAWLKAKVDEVTALELLNARDRLSRSALYYGCASGRVEIVLIRWVALDGCVALQDEKAAQQDESTAGITHLDSEPDAAGVLISDTLRTKGDWKGGIFNWRDSFPRERLDEITDLLATNGPASGARYIDQAISVAVEKKFDEATECLLRARERLGSTERYKLDEETSARLSQRNELLLPSAIPRGKSLILQHVESLLGKDKLHKDTSMYHDSVLYDLVKGGFARILDQVARPEAVHTIRTREDSSPIPLLVAACRREWWNMDVVRLLVEKKGADLNATAMSLRESRHGYGLDAKGPTALHALARGDHWWQTNEALSYLLRQGADIEARDERGITPLGAALESINGPRFDRKAVEVLLQFGADPNAVDNRGQTCLSRTGGHRDIYQLLIRHGAAVFPATMVDAIKRQDVTLLESILAGGVDANLRKPGQEVPEWTSPDGRLYRPGRSDPKEPLETYPLELLATQDEDKRDKRVSEKMLRLLLDHGANPSARYERTTVMHRLIAGGRIVRAYLDGKSQFLEILLQNPNLEMEAREDGSGMTILLTACSKSGESAHSTMGSEKLTLIQLLLEAGANVRAKDNKGRNALHIILSPSLNSHLSKRKNPDIAHIIASAPDLVYAVDNEDRTPLHTALHYHMDTRLVHELIAAGADVHASVKSTGNTTLHLLFRQTWVIGSDGEVSVGEEFPADPEPACETAVMGSEKQDSLFRRLLAMGVEVNARNDEGETPIFAFFREAVVSAKVSPSLFDNAGVDWTVSNRKGETMLHIVVAAEKSQRLRRFELLLGKGLDPMQEDKDHRTPLDVAAALGHDDILALFKTN
ncbi:hypothetical protein ACJ41O_006346 [Fusarium nematophilum]